MTEGEKKGDVGKRSEVRQTETNSRKQGLKEAGRAREGRLVKRVRTYRWLCSSYDSCIYRVFRDVARFTLFDKPGAGFLAKNSSGLCDIPRDISKTDIDSCHLKTCLI